VLPAGPFVVGSNLCSNVITEDDCGNVIAEDDATFAQASQFADVAELVLSIRVFSASGT